MTFRGRLGTANSLTLDTGRGDLPESTCARPQPINRGSKRAIEAFVVQPTKGQSVTIQQFTNLSVDQQTIHSIDHSLEWPVDRRALSLTLLLWLMPQISSQDGAFATAFVAVGFGWAKYLVAAGDYLIFRPPSLPLLCNCSV